jgi:hypothetical protein
MNVVEKVPGGYLSEADDSFTKPSGAGNPITDEKKVQRPYPTAII